MEFIGVDLPFGVWVPTFLITSVLFIVVYTFAVFITGPIVRFFWGLDAEDTFVKTAEKPLKVLLNTGNAVRAVLALPWRLRRKTAFAKIIGFRPEGLFHQTEWDQKRVDDKLEELASAFKRVCDFQESRRSLSRDGIVKRSKMAFWRAHNLAKHLGFDVRYSYTEYLPKETTARVSTSA